MPLTPADVSKAAPNPQPYKLADEKGLVLEIRPTGAKFWKLRYRFGGVEKKLALGAYPAVSLSAARQKRDAAREKLEEGIDPGAARRLVRQQAAAKAAATFRAVADEYLAKMEAEERTLATMKKARWFRDLIDRDIGKIPVADLTPIDLLDALRKLERRGHRETANRVRSFASRVCRYAIVTARATNNPADVLKGALIAPRPRHMAALTEPDDVGVLLRAIDSYMRMMSPRCLAPPAFLTTVSSTFIPDIADGEIDGHRVEVALTLGGGVNFRIDGSPVTFDKAGKGSEPGISSWAGGRSYVFGPASCPKIMGRCHKEITPFGARDHGAYLFQVSVQRDG